MGVTEIAALLHQSHPLVITWIKQLRAHRFVKTRADPSDRRRTVVTLTVDGVNEVRRLRKALVRMAAASAALMDEAAPGLLDALWRMERACRQVSFSDRLRKPSRARRG